MQAIVGINPTINTRSFPLVFLFFLLILITLAIVMFSALYLDTFDAKSRSINSRLSSWTKQQQYHIRTKSGNSPSSLAAIPSNDEIKTDYPQLQEQFQSSRGPISTYLSVHESFPILILCHNRVSELAETLDSLIAQIPKSRHKILVLQDGTDASVKRVVLQRKLALQSRDTHSKQEGGRQIAQHYGWALTQGFIRFPDSPAVIVLEDDLTPSPDFVDFFTSASLLLEMDSSLWCVSAWNDNGFQNLTKDPFGVRRTIFFPGLGWLLTREIWQKEFSRKWPDDHWDWFIRGPTMRSNRECVIPELPRVFHSGRKGTFVDEKLQARYFDHINANKDSKLSWKSPLARVRLSGLILDTYNERIKQLIVNGVILDHPENFSLMLEQAKNESRPLIIFYKGDPDPQFESRLFAFCKYFGIWHQIIRGSHEAVHELYHREVPVLLINTIEPRAVASIWFTSYPHESIFAKLAPSLNVIIDADTFVQSMDTLPLSSFTTIIAIKNEPCNVACERMNSGTCLIGGLKALNSCIKLSESFKCSECQNNIGLDQPAFAEGGRCLVNSGNEFSCEGKHPLTKRLCACAAVA